MVYIYLDLHLSEALPFHFCMTVAIVASNKALTRPSFHLALTQQNPFCSAFLIPTIAALDRKHHDKEELYWFVQ